MRAEPSNASPGFLDGDTARGVTRESGPQPPTVQAAIFSARPWPLRPYRLSPTLRAARSQASRKAAADA